MKRQNSAQREIAMKTTDGARRLRRPRLLIQVGLLLTIAFFANALNCRKALAASASAINQNAAQALAASIRIRPAPWPWLRNRRVSSSSQVS
jgi:hypothetical protein